MSTGNDQHGEQGADTPPALDANLQAAIAQAVQAAISGELPRVVNSAVSAHVRRALKDAQQPPANEPPAEPTGKDAQLAQLQRQVENLRKERDAQAAQAAEMQRDAALRRALEAKGVRDPEIALRALKPELRVEDGRYVHMSDDMGTVPAETYAESWLKRHTWLMQPTGKGGGGAPGESAGRPPAADALRSLKAEDLLSAAIASQYKPR